MNENNVINLSDKQNTMDNNISQILINRQQTVLVIKKT